MRVLTHIQFKYEVKNGRKSWNKLKIGRQERKGYINYFLENKY